MPAGLSAQSTPEQIQTIANVIFPQLSPGPTKEKLSSAARVVTGLNYIQTLLVQPYVPGYVIFRMALEDTAGVYADSVRESYGPEFCHMPTYPPLDPPSWVARAQAIYPQDWAARMLQLGYTAPA